MAAFVSHTNCLNKSSLYYVPDSKSSPKYAKSLEGKFLHVRGDCKNKVLKNIRSEIILEGGDAAA